MYLSAVFHWQLLWKYGWQDYMYTNGDILQRESLTQRPICEPPAATWLDGKDCMTKGSLACLSHRSHSRSVPHTAGYIWQWNRSGHTPALLSHCELDGGGGKGFYWQESKLEQIWFVLSQQTVISHMLHNLFVCVWLHKFCAVKSSSIKQSVVRRNRWCQLSVGGSSMLCAGTQSYRCYIVLLKEMAGFTINSGIRCGLGGMFCGLHVALFGSSSSTGTT